MKIAVVHDWLDTYAGAERVLEQILFCYPDADLFALVDFFDEESRKTHLLNKKATTTFIQHLPFARKKFRHYLPLMPIAIEQLDLSKYDVIISSSHAVAKGVITGPYQLHITYTNSLMRYIWDLQKLYLEENKISKGLRSCIVRYFLHKLRIWDNRTALSVDKFLANSNFNAQQIYKLYKREATIIHPSVNTDLFTIETQKDDYYLTVSRIVPYKRVNIVVDAFSRLPNKKLIVIGDGPDLNKIKKSAGANIAFIGFQSPNIVKNYMQKAKAFVFASEEVFGIAPIEAQACGTPVIAYGRGGCLDSIREYPKSNPTGIFFYEQTEEALIDALNTFETLRFDPIDCRNNSLQFSPENFRAKFKNFVENSWKDYNTNFR